MFSLGTIDVGTGTALRLFLTEDCDESYVITADLASAFGLQSPSIRGEMSKHNLGTLESVPNLKQWLRDQNLIPTGTGKLQFASSLVWHRVVKRHVTPDCWKDILQAYDVLKTQPTPIYHSSQEGEQERELSPSIGDVSPTLRASISGYEEEQEEQEDWVEERPHDLVVELAALSGNDSSIDSSNDSANDSGNDSSSSSDSSSDSSDADDEINALPAGVDSWVLSCPQIPKSKAFLPKDFTKSYSLKAYDMRKSLKKELKKQKKWWMRQHNAERPGKAIGSTTALKREERTLCFLGFVERYKVIVPGSDARLTLALYLNHRLFSSYLDYLRIVRRSSEGTIAEAITAAISACHWLYRKESKNGKVVGLPSIIRRFMDWRNEHQRKAAKTRQGKDKDELQEQDKWIEWDDYLALIEKLREDWTTKSNLPHQDSLQAPSLASARDLHDLLLLGLYSCIPSRGNETRLLQHFSDGDLQRIKKESVSFKSFVEAQRMNLIVSVEGVWKLYCGDFKVFLLYFT